MRIAILSNDVVPGMGLPVAAPGLRAWGMAEGLRAHGHDVTVIIEPWLISTVWTAPVPPPTPRGCVAIRPKKIADYVRVHGTEALIICNSNHARSIGDLGDCRLVYDFFAPKVLEMSENVAREDLEEALAKLEQNKLDAIGRSDAIAVNGAKKVPYVREWMARGGVPDLPLAVVNPGLPPMESTPPTDGPLRAIVTGYLQPWSRPGAWAAAVLPLLDEGLMTLDLLVAHHWGQRQTRESVPQELQRLLEHPAVERHGALRFGDFRKLLAGCHLSIDVFTRNPERELAMVTRSVVALATGVPVLHVPFTEVSPMIEEYDAGWLVDGADPVEITSVLHDLAVDRPRVAAARDGAQRLAREVLAPAAAAAPLSDLVEKIR